MAQESTYFDMVCKVVTLPMFVLTRLHYKVTEHSITRNQHVISGDPFIHV